MAEKETLSPSQRRKRKKSIIIAAVVALLVIAGIILAFVLMRGKGEENNEVKEIITSKPMRQTIELTVSGSGTIEPLDRYEIVSLVSGDVVSSPYEEGEMVREDDIVYVIDHEEQDKSIESAENALTRSKIRNKIYLDEEEFNKTLNKYTVTAEEDGIISGFDLEVDDKVSANGKICEIQNLDEIIATVPFNASQFEKIEEGDKATLYLYPSMYTKEGYVTYKSYKASKSVGGAVVYDVEITFDGSNITLTDSAVSATVHTLSGSVDSPASGTLGYSDPVIISPEVSGDVKTISAGIKNGAKVKKGDVLFTIDTDDFLEEKTLVEMDYHDLELNLENAKDRLDNYNIKSPISGTVITKNAKKGDTVSSGNNGTTLMVIADMSAMKFTFQADETDIEKIEVGQDVKVTADAVTGKVFTGRVDSVATEGTASNGVSYYNVEVLIENYGQNDEGGVLRSGMNVSAEIVYEKAEDALCVPVSAVTVMENESYVFVKGTSSADAKKDAEASSAMGENTENAAEAPEMKKERPENAEGENKTGNKATGEEKDNAGINTKENNQDKNREIMAKRLAEKTPEGFTAVKVETGATNGVMIAILSGIGENDEIYLAENNNVLTPVNSGGNMGLNGGYGGMGGFGGMPGGMPGGMRGGMR